MCTTAGVHGNIAEPLPVSLSSFLISSICISLFSPWCNIQNKPRTVRLQGLTGSCMWSVQRTLISISFGSHMALERVVFSITVVFFSLLHSYCVLWCFQSVPVNPGFSTLFVQTSSVSGVKRQPFVAF